MKHTFIILAAAALMASACVRENIDGSLLPADNTLAAKLVGESDGDIREGSLLVRLDDNAASMVTEGAEVSSIFGENGITGIAPALPVAPKNAEIARKYGLDKWFEISFDESESPRVMAERIAGRKEIRSIQYNSFIEHVKSDVSYGYTGSPLTKAGSNLPFNDPMLDVQWNLINTGDKSIAATAVAGADVGVMDAWDLTAGRPDVVVAVLDEGIRLTHEDLQKALWVNDKEKNGTGGKDDDGNGYADDTNGYNFAEGKSRPSASYNHDHGTHVAGTIAATNNNGKGVSSIAGGTGNGDGVRIMSCQIFKEGAKAADKTVAEAFIYAADNGACIAQCSYGSIGGALMSDQDYINGIENVSNPAPLEYAALQYFTDPANSNCPAVGSNIAVFAAGNDSGMASSYPGALPFCISVTAFGPDGLPGGYSNRGPGCDIAAPGGDPWLAPVLSNEAPCMVLSTGVDVNGGAGYIYKYGTSMACPHVSGVIALGMSYALDLGKKFTREEFISMLLTSVNDIDSRLGSGTKQYANGPFELSSYKGKMGTGAVDAWRFLNSIEGIPSVQAVPGRKLIIDLDEYLGSTTGNCKYAVTVDAKAKASLGLEGEPVLNGNRLELTCTKTGSGRITLSSSVGKDASREDGISGLDFSREISIVSRSFAAENGGWL
jgi:subtilisin family serine protease